MAALVRFHEIFKRFVALCRAEVANATVLEFDEEIVDDRSVFNKGKRAFHDTVYLVLVWSGENLFGGHICGEVYSVQRFFACARPDVSLGKTDF